jgi:UDP-N-acetylglucosamine acyltransferase
MAIHPTALVDQRAEIDPTAEIGAYVMIERDVRIGPEARIYSHGYVAEGTTLGRRCQIHPFAVVGHLPQDLKFEGAPSYTQVGDETIVREHATIHRGTIPGSTTVVGMRCFLMSTAHVAHNCVLGDDVKLANGVLLAGHVEVGSGAFLSGNAMVHQFVRIGELAMIGGGSHVLKDVPPFMLVGPPGVASVNVVGMRRAGLSSAERLELRECHRILYRAGLQFPDAVQHVAQTVRTEPGRRLVEFLRAPSRRGYLRLARLGSIESEDEDEFT